MPHSEGTIIQWQQTDPWPDAKACAARGVARVTRITELDAAYTWRPPAWKPGAIADAATITSVLE